MPPARVFALALLLGGCEGTLNVIPELLELARASSARCPTPAPLVLPRRLVRLSNAEVVATLSTIAPVDTSSLPPSWEKPATPPPPNPALSVTRSFLEQVSTLALTMPGQLTYTGRCTAAAVGLDRDCTAQLVRSLAHRVFRAQETEAEVDALVSLAMGVGGRSGSEAALRITMRAIAMSPRALYLFEGMSGAADPTVERPLSPAELASFLAYRVTGGPPGEGLIADLAQNPRPTVDQLRSLMVRHLGAAAVETATQELLSDWVDVPAIGRASKDLTRNPQATPAFMARLELETFTTLGEVVRTPGVGFRELLTAPRPSALYNDTASAAYAAVGRPGLFSMAGVVAATSGGFETNIPRRGRSYLRRLLCERLSSPPAGAVSQAPPLPEGATQRQRFEAIEASSPGCASCHSRIDPLAVPFEAWDEAGKARTRDEHGNLLTFDDVHQRPGQAPLRFTDAADLMNQLAEDREAQACFGSVAFTHFAREEAINEHEACAGASIVGAARADDGALPVESVVLNALHATALAPRAD